MSLPDFDIDFDERRRGEVIRYVSEKYGEDKVAYIVTYGTIKAKQALKDAARVLGHDFATGERLTKAMPPAVMGKDVSLSGMFDPNDKRYAEAGEFRQVVQSDPVAQEVLETAKGLENLKRQWGVHAAGVIIASEPLIDIIPIMRREQDGAVITQIDFPRSERDVRPERQALRRGRRVPPGRAVRPGCPGGARDRQGSGEPQAPVGRARGGRHHRLRAADRHHPDHAARAGRRRHHPDRLPEI